MTNGTIQKPAACEREEGRVTPIAALMMTWGGLFCVDPDPLLVVDRGRFRDDCGIVLKHVG